MSKIRLVVGGEKERVCDRCAREWHSSHAEELEENVDVRAQMNESLKRVLREKYEHIETLKRTLVEIIDSQQYLQEAPSLTAPFKFSSSMGLDRINFSDLVRYLDQKLAFLRSRTEQIEEVLDNQKIDIRERRRNFGFLIERTEKAEMDASRVAELTEQRDRLRLVFREQASKLRALRDRVEILEQRGEVVESNLTLPADIVLEDTFIGDRIANSICPCIKPI
jgi:hypothetical protein